MQDWGDCVVNGAASISCLEPLFANVVTALVSFIGLVLFIMLIVGGYNYLFAGGDAKKMEKAKGTLSAAVIGLVVIVAAWLIILLIINFTGLEVLRHFNIDIGSPAGGH
ncbi:hypothetical protein A2154_02285 [Candidatus Gottesmanbacteria bacterium RBG_16_43_7]|uniref:Uncharacterized protein n=1 Tax=Candidatus Gottesmanbacteria bacterium RBG_16_43_7 TaxID=1798373 RepID=A0A1F5ZAY9_9BACT|nr:MAG: hypothetical protein A2154_02285 [Candidatus Gottesmanbacteria bacterium RBG_16_43_7]